MRRTCVAPMEMPSQCVVREKLSQKLPGSGRLLIPGSQCLRLLSGSGGREHAIKHLPRCFWSRSPKVEDILAQTWTGRHGSSRRGRIMALSRPGRILLSFPE